MQEYYDATALAMAAYGGHVQIMDVLLKAGANPDIQDNVTINYSKCMCMLIVSHAILVFDSPSVYF